MECYCESSSPDFYHKTMRTARKKHTCYECGCKINPGENYEDLWASWDSDPCKIRTCIDCTTIRDALSEMGCFCWLHGSLLDDIALQFQEANFTPGLRYAYLRLLVIHRYRTKFVNTLEKI